MWTYHEETAASKSELYRHQPENEKTIPLNSMKHNTLKKKKTTHLHHQEALSLGGLYLCGLIAGSVMTTFSNNSFSEYSHYFANFSLSFYQIAKSNAIFGMRFLTVFLVLTVSFLLGFCAFGKWLLPLVLFLKGAGTGCFWIECIENMGFAKGFLAQILIFLLPEVIGVILIILLSKYALQISSMLWDCCRNCVCPMVKIKARQLTNVYLINCLAAIAPSLLLVILIRLFGSVCGLVG